MVAIFGASRLYGSTASRCWLADCPFERVQVYSDAYLANTFPVQEATTDIGDFGVDFSGADAVGLDVLLEHEGSSSSWSGQLVLHAVKTNDPSELECDSEPRELPDGSTVVDGCPGTFESSDAAAEADIQKSD